MLDLLKDFLTDLGGGAKTQALFDDNDYRVAAAALLIHVMTIDGSESAAEHETLALLLQDRFGLDEEAAAALVAAATEADREAVDLYRFTSLINRSLDEDGRRRIVEMMWQIVFADGQVNEFEDNIVWRAADLLGISSRDRVNLRRDVAGRAGKPATQS
ncbi:MAG: TerB family tellurite resistance protein [Pseudorhodoplanes sp.]